MSVLNLKETLDISFKITKQYIDESDEKKADKVNETELYTMLEKVFSESGNILGYVDENNSIVLNSNLASGTYILKYENEDGTYIDITEINVLDEEE